MPSTWLGRDSRGILRDFTADDIDETAMPAEVQGGGGEQTIRLLGPFSISPATPSIATGAVLPDSAISEGSVVISAWQIETVLWEVPDSDPRTLGIGVVRGEFDDSVVLRRYDLSGGGQGAVGVGDIIAQQPDDDASLNNRPYAHVWTGPVNLYVRITGTLPSSGGADIYALIAEPAS